ncbi:hypothetical protein [Coleofasciculus sp.]|uniref:hypothetical protein n=1 Tax=Coleofasciculus sp. TaxID=3100458 RepID=UPI003A32D095
MFNFSIRGKKQQFAGIFGITVLVISIAALYAFGVWGVGRGTGTERSDFRWFYTAGQLFLNGQNPYEIEIFSNYQSAPANTLGSQEVTGVPSALASVGLNMPDPFVLMLGGAVLTFLFWLGQSRLCSDDILGILVSIQIGLVYAHNPEIVLLAPLISSLWLHIAHRQKLLAIAVITLLFMFFPQRFIRPLNIPILNHWRAFLILFAFIALVFLSWQQKNRLKGAKISP